jgi:phage terminase small subunit
MVVPKGASVSVVKRPEPPPGLPDDAAEEWRAIVGAMSADYFVRPMHAVLEAYCVHAASLRDIHRRLANLGENDEATVQMYNMLLDMHARESRMLAMQAVRLGLAYATREFKAFGGKKASPGPKPWDK